MSQGLNSYVELRVCNPVVAEMRCAIQDAERRLSHEDSRRVWLYNAGCATERTSGCGVAYPFRLLPDHDATGFKAILGMLFGEATAAALPHPLPASGSPCPPARWVRDYMPVQKTSRLLKMRTVAMMTALSSDGETCSSLAMGAALRHRFPC